MTRYSNTKRGAARSGRVDPDGKARTRPHRIKVGQKDVFDTIRGEAVDKEVDSPQRKGRVAVSGYAALRILHTPCG